MEVASGFAGEAAKSCFALAMAKIKKEWSYIWRYNDNMNDLREKRAELETLKRQIEGEVEARERKREMIGPLADDLLRDVEAFLADDEWSAFMDENKIKKKDKRCFGVLHCNLTYRYRISKRATKRFEITKAKIKKMEDCKSRAVTLPGKPPELGSMPTAHSKSLASRESTLNEIIEALKNKEVHRIGIYGMGGIGKTTLIEEVARRAEAEGLFKVVIVEVSQAPDILKMQQQIAERIDLSLQGLKSEGERARAIYEVLKKLNHKEEDKRPKQQNLKEKDNHKEVKEVNQMSKKRTTQALVILDNMWKKLDLDKVGIPHDCKIALTTRSEDVCREMEANKKFGLQGLNDTEATELFLERARPSADHDDGYKSVTDELMKKCGGLPLAIVALANTLRDRNLSDWKHVADQLGKTVSARVGGPMEENVHPILEWSYNSISNKEKKKFFLLCCLFPLGSSIAIQDLMRYGAGLDLFQYMNSLGEAIEQAHSWATELKSSSLLLEADDEQDVRIHDIVREASISIATKGDNVYHIGSFPRWLTKETFQTYTTISMTSEDNHEPLGRFEFPKLEMLLLKGSLESKFSDNFFQGMKSLKVLVISGMKFQTLPSSITKLNNLRTLHLEHCKLSDISAIASLVDLLFLSLHESEIDELPKELGKLGNLKLLDLTKCQKLRKIPAGLIAMLTNLEGLYMMDSFLRWHPNNFESSSKKDELDDNKEMASLIELKSISSLTVLEMHVPKIYLLPHNLLFPHLSRFSISIGYKSPPCDNIPSKLLFLGEIDARRPLQQCITFLLKETEHLSLQRISGLKNVVDCLDKDGFRNLKCLFVEGCSDMEYIVTGNELNEDGGAFPKLETLTVEGKMDNLKVICHGPPSHYSFRHLKVLKLSKLGGLRNFCDDHDMHNNQSFFNEKIKFPTLEELEIRGVGGIVELWNLSDVDEEVPVFPILVNLSLWILPELRSIWRSKDIVIHRSFRSLKSLKVSFCPKLEILCPFSVAATLEQLETLNVEYNENMKEIIAKETGELKNNDTGMTVFPKLRNITLESLSNLKCFFGGNIKLIFPSLKSIDCRDLDEMVAFVSSEYPGDSGTLFNEKVKFPGLEELRISNVGGIKELWNLSDVEEEVSTFPKLVHLEVDSLPEMRSIWMSNDLIIHHIFQNLKNLTVMWCPNLKKLCPFSVAATLEQLETLNVESNENMKEIIAKEIGEMKNDDTEMTILPKLRNIELQSLSNLKCFFGGSIKLIFPSLKSINCIDLNEIVAFVSPEDSGALFSDKMKFPSLEELNIEDVGGIVELWNLADVEEEVAAFPRLVNLTLHNLPKLRSIWRSKDIIIHRSFRSLKSLKVSSCPKLEILCPFSVAAGLEQLETLNVENNENMKEIIAKETGELKNNDTGMTVFPKLRDMELWDLSNLKCFFGGSIKLVFPSLENIDFRHLEEIVTFVGSEYRRDSDALFNDKVALPAIKEIHMNNVNGPKEIWGSHLDAGSFNMLDSLTVSRGEKNTKVFSLNAIKQMRNLKELNLEDFQLAEELIERIGFYNDDVENSALLLPQLRKLTMDSFPQLKRIPWRELAFQNLRYLKIYQVKGLTYLFPASVGRRLENLEELDVNSCQMMEEIVGGESGDTNTVEVNVVFPHLNILRLCNLPALRSLSPDNVIIEFPSIIKAAFVRSQKSIPLDLLQKLHHVKELELEGCEIPLVLYDLEGRASTILPRLAKLTLSKMHRLQMIPWKIFPIENLHYLKISEIDGLKFLFPASLGSKGFAQLEEIHIWSCTDIEQVLAQESTDDTSNNAASTTIVFPRVKIIELSFLQSLRSFSSENYKDLDFPSLEKVEIWVCPMIEAFSYGSLSTARLRQIYINGTYEKGHLDLNAVIRKRKEEKMRWLYQRRIEEETSGEDTETQNIEGETSQGIEEETMSKDEETKFIEGETSQWLKKEAMSKDTETKFIKGEKNQGIEEDEMSKDAETQFIEGETSQGLKKEPMSKDEETKFIEGETNQGIEEDEMSKDTETKFIEEETSQGMEEETMSKDAEIEFREGETSQGIKEETMSKDAKTKFIEGETSQRTEEETMSKDAETKFREGETSSEEEEDT